MIDNIHAAIKYKKDTEASLLRLLRKSKEWADHKFQPRVLRRDTSRTHTQVHEDLVEFNRDLRKRLAGLNPIIDQYLANTEAGE